MRRLIIKQLGPVTSVDIELNKVNLIIGPQSSGKSTVNKVACYCSWVEKEISIRQDSNFFNQPNSFENNLVSFHKLEGFFCESTYISYESEVMYFSFDKNTETFEFKWKNQWGYKRCKTQYISAERNIIAAIPNWFDIKLSYNSIRSFMSAWEEARNCFLPDKQLEILNLGVNYYYNKTQKSDLVKISDDKVINFTNTSSGLQSLIPLFVVLKYITEELFSKKATSESIEYLTVLNDLSQTLYEFFLKSGKEAGKANLDSQISIVRGQAFTNPQVAEEYRNIYSKYTELQSTNIYMEEPEENLFATTQRDLVYSLLQTITSGREHNLFITTHSPYILYALNNCMAAYKVKDKINQEELTKQLPSLKACIDPNVVSLWQMKDGQLFSIKNPDTQTLGAHYFNEAMNEILNEYYIMMNFA